jgi:hypothetical protein
MQDIFALQGLAVVVFASTNVDDILSFLASSPIPKASPGRIVSSQHYGF